MNRLARVWAICSTAFLLLSLAAVQGTTSAQEGTQATITALETQAADLRTMVALQTEVASLSTQVGAQGTREPAGPPTTTPMATSPAVGTVLYEANAENGGFEDWQFEGGWLVHEGMLLNDGDSGIATAPFSTGDLANLAVEFELRVVEDGPGWNYFGLSIRGGDLELYALPYDPGAYIEPFLKGEEQIEGHRDRAWMPSAPDLMEWQTYRLEIDGGYAEISIDGDVLFSDTDNRLLRASGGAIMISNDEGLQLEVSEMRVIASDN
jgi:hypothetical protein